MLDIPSSVHRCFPTTQLVACWPSFWHSRCLIWVCSGGWKISHSGGVFVSTTLPYVHDLLRVCMYWLILWEWNDDPSSIDSNPWQTEKFYADWWFLRGMWNHMKIQTFHFPESPSASSNLKKSNSFSNHKKMEMKMLQYLRLHSFWILPIFQVSHNHKSWRI